MRLVQPPKIGGDNIVMGGHRYQKLDWHILRKLLARRRRQARVFARQFSRQSGLLQREYTRAFDARIERGRKPTCGYCWGHRT